MRVDEHVLAEIAHNNNKRVFETGDPSPLIVGHTSDDPTAPERPVVGFAVNYRVKPFRRDPKTGQVIYAIHTDYKVRKAKEHVIDDFPRRSVELWLSRKELDPIALLGGTTPERDLSVVIRKARLNSFILSNRPISRNPLIATDGSQSPSSPILRYSAKRGTRLLYELTDDTEPARPVMAKRTPPVRNAANCGPSMNGHGKTNLKPKKMAAPVEEEEDETVPQGKGYACETDIEQGPHRMEAGDDGMEDEFSAGQHDEPEGMDPAEEDPVVAKVFQSKAFKTMLQDAITEAIQGLIAEEEGGGAEGMPGEGGEPMQGADGLAPPPAAAGAGAPGAMPDEEARMDHEAPPVRFGAESGFAGPGSTRIPDLGDGTMGRRYSSPTRLETSRMSRNGQQQFNHQPSRTGRSSTTMNRTQGDPEVLRLSRENQQLKKVTGDLVMRLARSDARDRVAQLQNEGYVFGDPESEIELQAQMTPENLEYHLEEVVKKNYQRAEITDPTRINGSFPGVARYSRFQEGTTDDTASAADDNFQTDDPAFGTRIADVMYAKKLDYAGAVKYMREKGMIPKTAQRGVASVRR